MRRTQAVVLAQPELKRKYPPDPSPWDPPDTKRPPPPRGDRRDRAASAPLWKRVLGMPRGKSGPLVSSS